MELNKLIIEYLAESHEPIDSLARRAGVSRATIFRAKLGDYGDFKRIQLIVDAIGKPVTICPRSAQQHVASAPEARP